MFKDIFTVHVVHCVPDLTDEKKRFASKANIAAWHAKENFRAMQSVADILRSAGVPFELHGLVGFAPERIVELAIALEADAILMGAHGQGAFLDAEIGSVAGRVLAYAHCPVLLVKAAGRVS
ncbi:hypothetical protein CS8_002760 [Cupriavidus sp. 8B]